MKKPTVLIVGIGEVGRYLIEFLTRSELDLDILPAMLISPKSKAN